MKTTCWRAEAVRRRLLREKKLTLASAIEICRAAELTVMSLKAMTHDRPPETVHAADSRRPRAAPRQTRHDRFQNQPPGASEGTTCRFCGNIHRRGRELCPAYGKNCRYCGTANYFAKICMKKGQTTRQFNTADTEYPEDMSPSDTEAHIYTAQSIGAVQGCGKKWFVNIKINGGSQRCQLDSGATCDVMSITDMRRLAPQAKLLPSHTRLVLYSGHSIKFIGIFKTECVVRGKMHELSFEIVRSSQRPLLSGDTCERLCLMHFIIPKELLMVGHSGSECLTRQHLIKTYDDVFNAPVESLPGEVHFELDKDVAPVQASPRNVPVALRDAVKAQLDKHERDGHLASVSEPTEWISNMVIVRQPEKLRICIDPKSLNLALKRSHYIMPTLEDVFYKLPKARVFTLHARDAFLQCKLDEESSYTTTFWKPWGRKRWLKLPFGVPVAPEIYQRKQHELLARLKGVEPIADDILVVGCGDTDEEATKDHDRKLLELMDRCREVKLRLSLKKLQFRVREVKIHGHILSAEGLRVDPEKVRAVQDMPLPTDAKAVQRLIGFVTYLAKFTPHLSEVCEPLRRLLDRDDPWHWLPKHDAAVEEIKRLVTAAPILRYYDVTKPVTIQSDASQKGLGCCLLQEGQPIGYASRALTQTEQNYAHIEKEYCLSIVFACQRFHYYLYGWGEITAETDHKPLTSIFNKPLLTAPKRLQSMLLTLQNYNLKVIYKPGPDMHISDTLSRATVLPQSTDTIYTKHNICNLQRAQEDTEQIEGDEALQLLKAAVLQGWPDRWEDTPLAIREYWSIRDEINAQDGVLFKSQRVIVPKSLRVEMFSSPAQRLMSRRLRTPLPVAVTLLEPSVVTGVPDNLRVKHQTAKLWYDRSARDLPELSIGQDIRMKPLPGDRTGRWRRGVCMQQVAPRSYLVDVEGTSVCRTTQQSTPKCSG